jgi:hypothetical protein
MPHSAGLHPARLIDGAAKALVDEGARRDRGNGASGGAGRPQGWEAPRARAGVECSHDRR